MKLKIGQNAIIKSSGKQVVIEGFFDEENKVRYVIDSKWSGIIDKDELEIVPLIDWDKIKEEYKKTWDVSDINGQDIHGLGLFQTFNWFAEQVNKQIQ